MAPVLDQVANLLKDLNTEFFLIKLENFLKMELYMEVLQGQVISSPKVQSTNVPLFQASELAGFGPFHRRSLGPGYGMS